MHRYRFALRPGWLALHLLALGLIVTMVLLGRWQLVVSESKHFNVRNFGYALQWWAFSSFVAIMWVKMMLDQVRHDAGVPNPSEVAAVSADEPVAYRRYVPPTPAEVVDPTHAAYNDYLARLNGPASKEPS